MLEIGLGRGGEAEEEPFTKQEGYRGVDVETLVLCDRMKRGVIHSNQMLRAKFWVYITTLRATCKLKL